MSVDAAKKRRSWFRIHLSTAIVVTLGAVLFSGCDWGYRSRNYPEPFARVNRSVKSILKTNPTKASNTEAIYGSEKPRGENLLLKRAGLFWYEDIVVKVKKLDPRQTKVSVKYRENHVFIFVSRKRLKKEEKAFLEQVGSVLRNPSNSKDPKP